MPSDLQSYRGTKYELDPDTIVLGRGDIEEGGLCIVECEFEEKKGGLFIPEMHKKPAQRVKVYAVGPTDRGDLKVIEQGQTVYIHGWTRPQLWFTWGGKVYMLILLSDIECIVTQEGVPA